MDKEQALKVLGIRSESPNEEELKKAYRLRAIIYYIDEHSGDQNKEGQAEAFKKLEIAYSFLMHEKSEEEIKQFIHGVYSWCSSKYRELHKVYQHSGMKLEGEKTVEELSDLACWAILSRDKELLSELHSRYPNGKNGDYLNKEVLDGQTPLHLSEKIKELRENNDSVRSRADTNCNGKSNSKKEKLLGVPNHWKAIGYFLCAALCVYCNVKVINAFFAHQTTPGSILKVSIWSSIFAICAVYCTCKGLYVMFPTPSPEVDENKNIPSSELSDLHDSKTNNTPSKIV
ncbi:MAG: DnaJ domain-containing protein [Wolbachia endosymbiont of Tyrophagus putrescentiae]|nr:DnaJ domain-containing protein [Wolbachia endosymbiont of Tyrophagus putrescentiae]